jgi:FKBP-type peptidyl-prolyl cis-trans isomerase FkpA
MFKNNLLLVSALAAISFFPSCNQNGFEKADSGLQYKFLKNEEGDSIRIGDVVQMHVKYSTSKDSVLFNSFTMPQPITMEVPVSQFKGSFEEAVSMMTEGDSAQFLIAADSIFRKEFGAVRPSFIDSGSFLTFTVKILKKESKDAFQTRMEKEKAEKASKQIVIDEELIGKYIAEKGLKPTKTEVGVYIQTTKPSKGIQPVVGDSVKVQYTGRTLDGKVFDSSRKEDGGMGASFDFVLGVTPIIQGWQDGIAKMKQGEKATLIIPSTLAYGEQSTPRFGANSVLTFDVELVKVIKPKK